MKEEDILAPKWVAIAKARLTLPQRLMDELPPIEIAERLAERIHDDEVMRYFDENKLPEAIRQRGYYRVGPYKKAEEVT